MVIFETPEEWDRLRSAHYAPTAHVGFVPTMGALHQGHQSLFARCKEENEVCVGSIFVNPTQFNKADDLINYPRTLESDKQVAEAAGCDYLYVPSVETVYGKHTAVEKVSYGIVTDSLEGAMRPGHFDGVIAVVRKLLLAVRPTALYLGEKDFQQLAVLREMVAREGLDVEVRGCPLIRDQKGLALSSRNARLSKQGQDTALIGINVLREMKKRSDGFSPKALVQWGERRFSEHKGVELEYLVIIDEQSFEPLTEFNAKTARILVAFWVEGVRLIDNLRIPLSDEQRR